MADAPPDVDALIAAHLDDALDPAQAAALFAALKADAGARRTLLAAATHASLFDRQRLAGGATAPPRRRLAWRLAVAAGLLAAVGAAIWGAALGTAGVVRLDAASATTVRRGDSVLASERPWLRTGDRIVVGGGEARLSWRREGTVVVVEAGSEVVLGEIDGRKTLTLARGRLRADVAPQDSGGGFGVATAYARVDVVGTRFTVAADEREARVRVEHGAVRVDAGGAPAREVAAGFEAVCDGAGIRVGPALAAAPGATVAPAAHGAARRVVHLDAAAFASGSFTGTIGAVVDGAIAGIDEAGADGRAAVAKVQFGYPGRGGLVPLAADFELRAGLAVDAACTVAVVLVCQRAEDGAWIGNFQAERMVAAGRADVAFVLRDFTCRAGVAPSAGTPAVVSLVAVMAYSPPARLALRAIDLAASTPGG